MKILKIGAVWCPGCLVMKPLWEKIEKENSWLKNEYYDYDNDLEVINIWDVGELLPVFIFIDKDGKEILRLKGEKKESELLELINKYKNY